MKIFDSTKRKRKQKIIRVFFLFLPVSEILFAKFRVRNEIKNGFFLKGDQNGGGNSLLSLSTKLDQTSKLLQPVKTWTCYNEAEPFIVTR